MKCELPAKWDHNESNYDTESANTSPVRASMAKHCKGKFTLNLIYFPRSRGGLTPRVIANFIETSLGHPVVVLAQSNHNKCDSNYAVD